MKHRALVIGLDAADPDLVGAWIREGRLPTMASLLARGSWAKLASPADISTGPAWPAFFASTSPARQGRFFYRQLKTGTYRLEKKSAKEIQATPFWLPLSRAGKRIAIINVPKTYPMEGVNGIQLVGWGVHSPSWKRASSPPKLLKEVLSRFGPHPIPNCDELPLQTPGQYREFRDRLISGAERKGLLSEHLLRNEEWDLFVTVFQEPHCGGHHLWHVIDPRHPEHRPELAQNLGNVLRDLFETIDRAVAKLVQAAPDSAIMLFSPHGMGPNYGGSHLLPEVLRRLKMMATNGSRASRVTARVRSSVVRIRDGCLEKVPLPLVRAARRAVPPRLWDGLTCRVLAAGNKWERSRAFCIPGDFAGAIRINLKGREPKGRVGPGSEYDELCEELKAELERLVDPATGRKVVREVVRIDRIYHGEYLWDFPDLAVKWTGDAPISAVSSPRIGVVAGIDRERRSGEDRSEGFLIACGGRIVRGACLTAEEASTMDVGPTLLYLMGEQVPQDIDGKVLLPIVDESFRAANPVTYTP